MIRTQYRQAQDQVLKFQSNVHIKLFLVQLECIYKTICISTQEFCTLALASNSLSREHSYYLLLFSYSPERESKAGFRNDGCFVSNQCEATSQVINTPIHIHLLARSERRPKSPTI